MGREFFKRVNWVDAILYGLRIVIIFAVIYGAYNTLSAGKYTADQWLGLVMSGLAQGSIYALIALGYTLVYGILLMINFAHGEIFMAGAFTAVFAAEGLAKAGWLETPGKATISIILLVLLAATVSTFLAVLLERVAYRPLRGAPRLVPLITAIGASFFLQYTFKGFYGSGFKSYPLVPMLQGGIPLGAFSIPRVQVVVIVLAIVLMAALYFLVEENEDG